MSAAINDKILQLALGKIDNNMVIAIDPGDIMKPYAKPMAKLCGIYNGSQGDKARGYHLCQVTAANLKHDNIVPLYCEAFSSLEQGYKTTTEKVIDIITKTKHCNKRNMGY
ncbi:MAG: hypothetical protein JKY33_07960 [Bacteroidia bacterium]|nr:hypothetical protein [Bacteroidia bacterium]